MRGIAAGIDFGTTTITTVVGRREKDGALRLLGAGSAPASGMRRGNIIDVAAVRSALAESLAEAERESGARIRSAVIGVGGPSMNSFSVRGTIATSRADGEITEEDVERVIQAAEGFIAKNPNREILHIVPREYKVDGMSGIPNPVGMIGMKLEVEALVIDGPKPVLANIIKCCEAAGLEIENWASNVLAASEALLPKPERELGVMLLDLGAGTSDFAIFEEGRLVDVGSFPIGGGLITSDIAIGFRTAIPVAEQIKLKFAPFVLERTGRHDSEPRYGGLGRREEIRLADFTADDKTVYGMRDLSDIVTARLSDIFELVLKALRRTGRAGLLPGGVVLTGGVAAIPGIQDLARRELKLPVSVAREFTIAGVEEVIPSRYAVPVGLILWQEEQPYFARHRKNVRFWTRWQEELKGVLRSLIP